MTKPDILTIIQGEGVELKQRGKSWRALCPLHQEKTPSFTVNPEKQLFHCFGCGKGGDAIQFIQELKGLSFKEACAYLNLERPRPTISPGGTAKKHAIESFWQWCKDQENELCDDLQALNRIALSIETPEDIQKWGPIFPAIEELNYYLDILQGKDDEMKFKFYLEERKIV
jgi:hypothetical protein